MDPQGTLNTQFDHQNDSNPEVTNPLEIAANDFMNTPDQQDSLTFDQALTDIEILLDVPLFSSVIPAFEEGSDTEAPADSPQ